MLKLLRGLSPEAKKKVVAVIAGVITVFIFIFWLMHFFGIFSKTFETTATQGTLVFDFVEKNVGDAYNAFHELTSKSESALGVASSSTETMIEASTTEAQTETTNSTIQN